MADTANSSKPFFFMLLALLCAAAMAVVAEAQCRDANVSVYALGTPCDYPAQYSWRYSLLSASDRSSWLAPEWDETNATYYVRLSNTGGATYFFTYTTRELRPLVRTSDSLFIVNVDSGRYLGWRDEDGEKFLVELSDSNSEYGSLLRFDLSSFDRLACILIYPPRACNAYDILGNDESGNGIGAYVEDGVTYFKIQSDVFPFLLIRADSGSTASSHGINGLEMSTYRIDQ